MGEGRLQEPSGSRTFESAVFSSDQPPPACHGRNSLRGCAALFTLLTLLTFLTFLTFLTPFTLAGAFH